MSTDETAELRARLATAEGLLAKIAKYAPSEAAWCSKCGCWGASGCIHYEARVFLASPAPAVTPPVPVVPDPNADDIDEARERIHSTREGANAVHCRPEQFSPGFGHSFACNKEALRIARGIVAARSSAPVATKTGESR